MGKLNAKAVKDSFAPDTFMVICSQEFWDAFEKAQGEYPEILSKDGCAHVKVFVVPNDVGLQRLIQAILPSIADAGDRRVVESSATVNTDEMNCLCWIGRSAYDHVDMLYSVLDEVYQMPPVTTLAMPEKTNQITMKLARMAIARSHWIIFYLMPMPDWFRSGLAECGVFEKSYQAVLDGDKVGVVAVKKELLPVSELRAIVLAFADDSNLSLEAIESHPFIVLGPPEAQAVSALISKVMEDQIAKILLAKPNRG